MNPPAAMKLAAFFVAAVAFFHAAGVSAECTKEHPFSIGAASGTLNGLSHGVSGVVTVVDDCTFQVDLTYDGEGPAAYWYGAKTLAEIGNGIKMEKVEEEYTGEVVTFKLTGGATWDTAPALSVWCEDFSVDFGSVVLSL